MTRHPGARIAGPVALALLLALAVGPLAGCASQAASGSSPAVATTVLAARGPIAGRFEVGAGRSMYLECSGTGPATVVLVSGQRSSALEWHTSQSAAQPPAPPVFEELARSTRVCAYDRPGTVVGDQASRSDPVRQPIDATRSVADLHALLAAADEPGPYVLVGHSIGGLIARLYAATYPDEVRGMVLVDAASEFLQDAESPDEWLIQRALMRVDASQIPDSVAEYPDIETWDIDAAFAQLRAAPGLHPMPLVVLSADELLGPRFPAMIASGAVPAGTPRDFGATFDAAQAKAQARLAELVPDAVHITETHSGHEIHLIQPQLAVAAVGRVIAAAADERT